MVKEVSMHIEFRMDHKLFLKDPNSSELGKKMIEFGVKLMAEIGFEAFTFKKLATEMGSTEPSLYRYFENKHMFLLYLLSCYWNWVDYKIDYAINNIESPEDRLKIMLRLLAEPDGKDAGLLGIDEKQLYRIVVSESPKVFHIKNVDFEQGQGYFSGYQRLCKRLTVQIRQINPTYRFPSALASTIIESAQSQRFFAEHLPSVTEIQRINKHFDTAEFITDLVFGALRAS
jgi:AcrR family transcriptional regulator